MIKKQDLIYGIRAVIEALKSGQHLERIFIQKTLKGDLIKELMFEIHQSKTPLSKVPPERINKFTKKNHQGVVALISPIQYSNLEHLVLEVYERGEVPLFLLLDEITDVRNFGAIARTAECMGVHGVVIPIKGGAQVNEDAIKTSAGALNYLPVCREKSLLEAVEFLKASGISIISCTEKSESTIHQADFKSPSAIIMGSEEKGISEELLSLSDQNSKIPMTGKIESLNVSVAAGMILYEAHRQRS